MLSLSDGVTRMDVVLRDSIGNIHESHRSPKGSQRKYRNEKKQDFCMSRY